MRKLKLFGNKTQRPIGRKALAVLLALAMTLGMIPMLIAASGGGFTVPTQVNGVDAGSPVKAAFAFNDNDMETDMTGLDDGSDGLVITLNLGGAPITLNYVDDASANAYFWTGSGAKYGVDNDGGAYSSANSLTAFIAALNGVATDWEWSWTGGGALQAEQGTAADLGTSVIAAYTIRSNAIGEWETAIGVLGSSITAGVASSPATFATTIVDFTNATKSGLVDKWMDVEIDASIFWFMFTDNFVINLLAGGIGTDAQIATAVSTAIGTKVTGYNASSSGTEVTLTADANNTAAPSYGQEGFIIDMSHTDGDADNPATVTLDFAGISDKTTIHDYSFHIDWIRFSIMSKVAPATPLFVDLSEADTPAQFATQAAAALNATNPGNITVNFDITVENSTTVQIKAKTAGAQDAIRVTYDGGSSGGGSSVGGSGGGGGGGGGGARAPFTSSKADPEEKFVDVLYMGLLGRKYDGAGFAFWVEQLESGKMTYAQVARHFIFSEEVKAAGLTDVQFVTRLYNGLLGRNPDASGLDFWVAHLGRGVSKEAIFNAFIASPEFTARLTALGLKV